VHIGNVPLRSVPNSCKACVQLVLIGNVLGEHEPGTQSQNTGHVKTLGRGNALEKYSLYPRKCDIWNWPLEGISHIKCLGMYSTEW